MFRLLAVLIILGGLVLSALVSVPTRAAAAQSLFLSLREGQTAIVAGTGLTITARKVTDRSSVGCLGGPIGCPD